MLIMPYNTLFWSVFMNQYQSISDLKDSAKNRLTGSWSNAVLINLSYHTMVFAVTFIISFMITIIISLITLYSSGSPQAAANYELSLGASAGVTALQYGLTLLCTIFGGIFQTGIALFFLNLASGRNASIGNLFYGFQYLYKQSLTLSAVSALLQFVCLLPYYVFTFLLRETHSTTWGICMIAALIAGMIIYIPISLSISQSFFLLLDFPSRSAAEILRLSVRLMKGRKRRLFLIQLSFLPLMLLGTLSFGLGNLWVTPYMNMTLALYFLDIMKPSASEPKADCERSE